MSCELHCIYIPSLLILSLLCFFLNDTATTEIYTLSLHDALPICGMSGIAALLLELGHEVSGSDRVGTVETDRLQRLGLRSEEHTSELQSRQYLVCRLLLEKKKKSTRINSSHSNITYAYILYKNNT